MWRRYNPNPQGKIVGDCVIRALTIALNLSWEKAYDLVVQQGYRMADMPSSDSVWGEVLREHGFKKIACLNCTSAECFADTHNSGIYVLAFGGHVATIKDGILYDSWNSLQEVPIYFWYKKEV